MLNRKICIAPMLDWTDRYFRYFLRLISRHTLLYSEMITTGALLHGDTHRHLDFNPEEHPLALQLGGSNPDALAKCTLLGSQWGYDEINLNVGCPSDRVQAGKFGASLMAKPSLVADCIKAMRDAADIPVTIKHRIGIDNLDSYQSLTDFVGKVTDAGCQTFIVHARKAWLKRLSPKENREVPLLQYDTVYQLKTDFPKLEIIINGGISTLEQTEQHLAHVDGVMIGREAYHNPWLLAEADRRLFDDNHPIPSRHSIIERLMPFVEMELSVGVPISRTTRHILGLFQGEPGARAWRRHLSENAYRKGAGTEVILEAAGKVPASP
ncbi:tRNA dihydrouridine(20/20a) synthase DusA [Candidatus Vondammii sp. HM_W22]|uniref:tRNA dihydrouridine(20/20a) synthase DusA n=1 Tax=Candidatus Vondammii sp. HM_W22 TaxID=2687299 RepID=UPI001F139187|nr:tRNA dihydrouridine(20/20a) synthase DusA [Candidatus Vondammii sp. HM_W22]